jgi:hypothetical protein
MSWTCWVLAKIVDRTWSKYPNLHFEQANAHMPRHWDQDTNLFLWGISYRACQVAADFEFRSIAAFSVASVGKIATNASRQSVC